MVSLGFSHSSQPMRQVLCLGAHSDDIEIGCGGTILKLTQMYPELVVHWIVFSSTPERRVEAIASAEAFLSGTCDHSITVYDFRDGYFPYVGAQIKDIFEALKQQLSPDLVFTHYRHDRHQDHRVISDLTWNTFRNHLILEYEIPKYDGDLGAPSVYVQLEKSTCDRKISNLLVCFGSQGNKHWFTAETFLSILRLRGVEARAVSGYAEAFYAHKIVLA